MPFNPETPPGITTGTSGAFNTLNTRQYPDEKEIGIVTSTNIQIKINGQPIGLIQSLRRDESRDVQRVMEIGTEGLVQLVPQNYQGGTLSVDALAVYGRLFFRAIRMKDWGAPQSFIANYNPVGMLVQNRIPFTVEVLTRGRNHNKGPGSLGQIREIFHGCFLTQYGKTVQISDVTVTETVQIAYARVVVTDEKTSANGPEGYSWTLGNYNSNPIEDSWSPRSTYDVDASVLTQDPVNYGGGGPG